MPDTEPLDLQAALAELQVPEGANKDDIMAALIRVIGRNMGNVMFDGGARYDAAIKAAMPDGEAQNNGAVFAMAMATCMGALLALSTHKRVRSIASAFIATRAFNIANAMDSDGATAPAGDPAAGATFAAATTAH